MKRVMISAIPQIIFIVEPVSAHMLSSVTEGTDWCSHHGSYCNNIQCPISCEVNDDSPAAETGLIIKKKNQHIISYFVFCILNKLCLKNSTFFKRKKFH